VQVVFKPGTEMFALYHALLSVVARTVKAERAWAHSNTSNLNLDQSGSDALQFGEKIVQEAGQCVRICWTLITGDSCCAQCAGLDEASVDTGFKIDIGGSPPKKQNKRKGYCAQYARVWHTLPLRQRPRRRLGCFAVGLRLRLPW
jgi:hypothetical protein